MPLHFWKLNLTTFSQFWSFPDVFESEAQSRAACDSAATPSLAPLSQQRAATISASRACVPCEVRQRVTDTASSMWLPCGRPADCSQRNEARSEIWPDFVCIVDSQFWETSGKTGTSARLWDRLQYKVGQNLQPGQSRGPALIFIENHLHLDNTFRNKITALKKKKAIIISFSECASDCIASQAKYNYTVGQILARGPEFDAGVLEPRRPGEERPPAWPGTCWLASSPASSASRTDGFASNRLATQLTVEQVSLFSSVFGVKQTCLAAVSFTQLRMQFHRTVSWVEHTAFILEFDVVIWKTWNY